MNAFFQKVASRVTRATGSPWATIIALIIIVAWFVAGLIFGFTDTMQLLINTGTTIVTFLMVFLIQSSQNHDTDALNLKLDAIIHAIREADDEIAKAEDMSPDELKARLDEKRQTE